MPNHRWRSLLRLFLIGVVLALPLACMQVTANTHQLTVAPAFAECSVGSQGCSCTAGGGCDPGLYCDGGICVGDSYGDEESMFEDDMMVPAPAPPPMVVESKSKRAPARDVATVSDRGRRGANQDANKADRKLGKRVASPAEAAPSGGAAAPTPTSVDVPELTATESDPADVARQVIYTALLHISVYDLDAAAELTESLPQRYGGWIESRYDYQITVRIRANRLFDAMKELMELGVVLDRTLLAEDVTAEYIDLDSRILVLEEIVAQLEALLARATSVEEALKIRVELDRVRLELESARVRMRQLSELIDFSTLTVILSPRTEFDQLPTSNDPFPWVDTLGVEITAYR
ncbi:hypothetical protein DB30_03758 [Enhygromyxa salina]|uniref:DUF4349 domain-containing protein n=1 Tax=Enhygromyxa salina TaxID=215803 RepID=A0A0C2D1Q2_9BACT|nr:DUF4349 domain-containing protein [Enhygromyxa salina]KIG17161.1 hypothetical protein DB30_03758 [Enhygromyxa salina]